MGEKVDLTYQVQGILPVANGGCPTDIAALVFVDNETPSGAVDGSNSTFTLAAAPVPAGSLLLFQRPPASVGSLMFQSIDYTLAGATITTTAPPTSGGNLRAWYRTNQRPLLIKGEQLSMSDSIKLRLQFSPSASDSIQNWIDAVSFDLTVSQMLFNGQQMVQSDSMSFVKYTVKSVSDTNAANWADAFAKLLT